ncbi:hypothetical protein PBI_LUCKY2013_170 [Mycobacterium phage Lucky2013]|nr:hypothetical protein PORCELAIN_174 [Mycobacterium phage Porcelain]ASD53563.1 hypothetical protein PBI_LUCKY2013_170 [Mycobacterium phage Lucky2013]
MRKCSTCDQPFENGEPTVLVSGEAMHPWCDLTPGRGGTCDTDDCHWRWTYHAGACVV